MVGEFNAPYIFIKFYAPNNCEKCRIGTPDDSYIPTRKQLFAVTPAYLQQRPNLKFFSLKKIYYPNKTVAFQIGSVVQ